MQYVVTAGWKRDSGKYPKTWDSFTGHIRAASAHSTYLFTLVLMARLGGRIYLSCNVVHIGFSFDRIFFD
jgi:hypothetical protein